MNMTLPSFPSRGWDPVLRHRILASATALFSLLFVNALYGASPTPVPNADFDEGKDAPTAWILSGGSGRWVDREVLEVTGSGSDSNYWRCDDFPFEPGSLYHFQMRARRASGSGCVIAGPTFANRDYRVSNDWKWYGHVFRTPEKTDGAYLRVGQWHATGTVQFDAVRITRATAVLSMVGKCPLGEGESERNGHYRFHGDFRHPGSNYHRTLHSATAGFNSDRWCFGTGSQVTYRFSHAGCKFRTGGIAANVSYHTRGGCMAQVSRDGTEWRTLGIQNELGTLETKVPADMLPAETIFMRLSGTPPSSSFQVNRVEFEAELDGMVAEGNGGTTYADIEKTSPKLAIHRISVHKNWAATGCRLVVQATPSGQTPRTLKLLASVKPKGTPARPLPPVANPLMEEGIVTFPVTIPIQQPGEHQVTLKIMADDTEAVRTSLALSMPHFYRTDYGKLVAGVTGDTAVWWCDATHKIPRHRAPPGPSTASPAVRLSAAKNDREAVQIVVRPGRPLRRLTAKASPLTGPDGATIPAENVRILWAYYHYVHHPTDETGVRDFWPDALPPLAQPIDVPAKQNQPLWVLVHVPKDAKAGDYNGEVSLEAQGFSATVPIKLHVWNFALPERNHIQTAFGLSAHDVFRYHQLNNDADRRKVLDMYFTSFAEHRISPYDPTPLDPIRVTFLPDAKPPRTELDFSAFDRQMQQAVDRFHFTGLRLPIKGMGGGSFHSRYEPKIGKHGEDTPQYQAMFSSYVKQLENHLREKGWLNMAYIYWFDEPAPRDYQFVANGMRRLAKHAPDLQRMLTEEPGDNALAGTVDIWCPVSHNYDHKAADKRRACGEQFWWYVCCGPKAPYCTLFIDHPATELRVWLWQTWQRNIVGTLVWRANYWTSSAAYPETPQDPYADPMGYVSGYSTPRGVKRYWGNGDGRFIYPPLSAAVPGKSGPGPVIEPPVSSIRWEMLREGIEDYEYLYLLRELLNQRRADLAPEKIEACEALLKVPESITKDMTTFSTDPEPIYARRRAIAEAIEQLVTR